MNYNSDIEESHEKFIVSSGFNNSLNMDFRVIPATTNISTLFWACRKLRCVLFAGQFLSNVMTGIGMEGKIRITSSFVSFSICIQDLGVFLNFQGVWMRANAMHFAMQNSQKHALQKYIFSFEYKCYSFFE